MLYGPNCFHTNDEVYVYYLIFLSNLRSDASKSGTN